MKVDITLPGVAGQAGGIAFGNAVDYINKNVSSAVKNYLTSPSCFIVSAAGTTPATQTCFKPQVQY
jgi:hypothetical protein